MPPRSVPPAAGSGAAEGGGSGSVRAHFRAHERRAVRLVVELVGQQSGVDRQAVVIDLSLAGAGLQTEEPLVAGDRVSMALSTPTMWDPLVIEGVVAWAHPPSVTNDLDALGRPRVLSRAGVAFEYPDPKLVLSMFEMLATLGYE